MEQTVVNPVSVLRWSTAGCDWPPISVSDMQFKDLKMLSKYYYKGQEPTFNSQINSYL